MEDSKVEDSKNRREGSKEHPSLKLRMLRKEGRLVRLKKGFRSYTISETRCERESLFIQGKIKIPPFVFLIQFCPMSLFPCPTSSHMSYVICPVS